MFKNILVAIDGSPTSMQGLREAIALARDQKAQLHALHVIDTFALTGAYDAGYMTQQYIDEMEHALRKEGAKVLDKARTMAVKTEQSVNAVLLERGATGVAEAILAQARKLHADVIVLGTHGRRGLRRVLMGSDAEAVVRAATVPVLLVRAGARTTRSEERKPARRTLPKHAPASPAAMSMI